MFKHWLGSNVTLLTTFIISMGIHFGLSEIYSVLNKTTSLNTNQSIEHSIKVNITTNQFKKESSPPANKVIEKSKTKKIDKPLVVTEAKKELLVSKVIAQANVKVKPKKHIEETTSPIKIALNREAIPTTQGILVNKTPDNYEKEQLYFAQLLRHIEQHKFYPKKAKRRQIEGTVMISFSLDSLGNTKDLHIDEGHQFLRKAAKQAIKDATPLPKPPEFLSTPKTIHFGMTYQLEK